MRKEREGKVMKKYISVFIAAIMFFCYPLGCFAETGSKDLLSTVSYNYIYNVSQADYDSKYKNDPSRYSIYETTTNYRYRDKSTVNSGQNSLSGYTYVKNVVDSTTYGRWQGGALNNAGTTNSNTTKTVVTVETKSCYRCRAYYNNAKTYYWKAKNNGQYPNSLYIYSSKSVASGYKKDSDGAYNLPKTIKPGTGTNLGEIFIISTNGNWASSFTSGSNKGIYVWYVDTNKIYRNKTVKSHNVFEKWGNWSGWSTTQYTASATRQVETQKIYTIRETIVQEDVHTHQWNSYYTMDYDSTCYSYGKESIRCSTCGAKKDGSERNIALKSHSWGDYTIDSYATCTTAGVKSRHCKVCNTIDSSSITTYTVDHAWNNSYEVDKEATSTQDGVKSIHCIDCGAVKADSEVVIPKIITYDTTPELKSISKKCVTIKSKVYYYTGTAIKPAVTVKYNGKTLKQNRDYKLSYSNNKNPGSGKVTVKGIGNYTGKVTAAFKIQTKPFSITKIKRGKKKFTVYWKKATAAEKKGITGFQIRYTKKSNLKSGWKTSTGKKNTYWKLTLKNAKAKTKYYVELRSFVTVKIGNKKKTFYSPWSKPVRVVTK